MVGVQGTISSSRPNDEERSGRPGEDELQGIAQHIETDDWGVKGRQAISVSG